MKICKVCKQKFTPSRQGQVVCSIKCAHEYSKLLQAKKQRKNRLIYRASDKKTLTVRAQAVFNKFIRLRDAKQPCISCGYKGEGRIWTASHFRPVGRNSALRFSEDNCHKACSKCNLFMSGNLTGYEQGLIKKIGLERTQELKSNNSCKTWTIDELKEIINLYKTKIRDLNEKNSCKF